MWFNGKSKKTNSKIINTILNGNTAKGRQEALENLKTYHDDLKFYLDIKNNSLSLSVGKNSSKIIGTVDSSITRELTKKYGTNNGLSIKLEILQDYQIITDKNGLLACMINLKVVNK